MRSRLPELSKEEVEFIRGTYDFMGLNYYTTFLVRNDNASVEDLGVKVSQGLDWQKSASSWLRVNFVDLVLIRIRIILEFE